MAKNDPKDTVSLKAGVPNQTDVAHRDAAVARLADRAMEGARQVELQDLAAQIICDTLDVELSAVLEHNTDRDTVQRVAGIGWHDDHDNDKAFLEKIDPRLYEVLCSGDSVVVSDWASEQRFTLSKLLSEHGVASSINVAIPRRGTASQPWGLLGAYSCQPREFSSQDVRHLQRVAYILAFSTRYAWLLAKERESSMLVRAASHAARIGGWEVEPSADRAIWSEEICALHGMPVKRTVMTLAEARKYMEPESQERAAQAMARLLQEGEPFDQEIQILTDQGKHIWVRNIGEPVYDEAGQIIKARGAIQDITKHKLAREEMDFLALHDSLTQLPNRQQLEDRVLQAIANSKASGRKAAIMLLDLDDFKTLNDTMGHAQGDRLLQQVAKRLTDSVREGDTAGRFGGDEFVLIINELDASTHKATAQAERLAEKILARLRQPYQLGATEYLSTQSMGITLLGFDNDNSAELFKQADVTMYAAKTRGRNRICIFDPELQEQVKVRATLERDMHKGLKHNQFQAYYQAQVDTHGRPIGAEALIRWQHPHRGLLSPANFVPIAEQSGLIQELGQTMLETVCRQLARWAARPDTASLDLSVNVSARQFHHPRFVTNIKRVIKQTGANPHRLTIELTETSLLDNIDDTIKKMHALGREGITFSLDDFGTGYSSLYYLKHLPLTQLKIDKSFVRNAHRDASDATIIRTILALAGAMGLDVIAEGVETKAERDFLASEGCTAYQGFLFCSPKPIEQFEAYWRQAEQR